MKSVIIQSASLLTAWLCRTLGFYTAIAFFPLVCLSAPPTDRYVEIDLISDLPGLALQDTNLVNSWGVAFSSSSPFWVSDNGSGKSTLYSVTNDAAGNIHVDKVPLEVNIPGEGNPTGMLFNGTGGFHNDVFIFASEDGTISGWRNQLGTNAEVLTVRTSAVYKGITLTTSSNGPVLLAANFAEGTIDAYGTNLMATQFADPDAPEGYAPFNVETLQGMIFVTFAKQDAEKHDDVKGRGHGLIDTFDLQTGTFHRFVTGSDAGGNLNAIDSPWGMAVAPSSFGAHADQLLVGNFGSGKIMTFDPDGRFRGFLENKQHKSITIDGLWALAFGNNGRAGTSDTLFFSAGPDDESHGLFGAIEPLVHGNQH